DREAARARSPPEGPVHADAPLRAEPHPLAPDLARYLGARAGSDLAVLVLLPRAGAGPRPLRDGDGGPHAHPLLPGGRARGGRAARLLRRVPQVLRLDAAGGRRLRADALAQQDLARA